MAKKRANYLGMWEYRALDIACRPLNRAFDFGVYLVGSCMERGDYRDVDVRAILSDDAFQRMFPDADAEDPFHDPRWSMVCMGISLYLKQCSGLPIDFQIQAMTPANEKHDGTRSALGLHRDA